MHDLFDPARHEPLAAAPWHPDLARSAIARICRAADTAFDEATGSWLLHPRDDPPQPGARSLNFYWGAAGVVWALLHLQAAGAVPPLQRDYTRWITRYPDGVRQEAAGEQHGSASYLFGESAPLLLAWLHTREPAWADRLHAVVQSNLHNPANEPLWGNAGTLLAAIRMAEAGAGAHWQPLVQDGVDALLQDMAPDPDTGTWTWHQDLYGHRTRYLGAGHGLAGNAYAAWRASGLAAAKTVTTVLDRTWQTLAATALSAAPPAGHAADELVNWHALTDSERIALWLANGRRPLVQDCHGAPGIVCRLAGTPRSEASDRLLRGAGELTWFAGPLAKGPSLCHGTAGSAMACLKLWRHFGEPLWLERARALALHAAGQVEAARGEHGQGRHSLWTGDLGVACVLWNCVVEDDRFPTLDHF